MGVEMKKQRFQLIFVLAFVLIFGLFPANASTICIQDDSGAEYNFDVLAGKLLTGTIEVPGACPVGPLLGSFTPSDTPGKFEIGWWVNYNTQTTGCPPQVGMSGTIDGSLNGTGMLTFILDDGTVGVSPVIIAPCGTALLQDKNQSLQWSK